MHCSDKDIAQASDKTSMPLAAVFSQKVKKNNKTLQQREDIFSLSLGFWAAMKELSVPVGHAISCPISQKNCNFECSLIEHNVISQGKKLYKLTAHLL